MTTYASFISTVSGVSITSVVTQLDYEPLGKHTPDLPCSFVRLPGGGTNLETATTCSGDGKTRTVDLVVIGEPIGQSMQEANFDATVAMMDYVETALDTLYTSSIFEYEIASGQELIGEVYHWAVIASCNLTE